ncbi:MAG: YqbH/XkdH family protein [Clostridium sp.]|nr:YqbH/XkdH family protein [Clostridium sp.]
MAFMDLLDHKCNIYHLVKTERSPGFGLSLSPSFCYPEIPDEKEVTCHFGVESLETSVEQKNPNNVLQEKIKLTLPLGTDIRINDKIIDCKSGLECIQPKDREIFGIIIFLCSSSAQKSRRLCDG